MDCASCSVTALCAFAVSERTAQSIRPDIKAIVLLVMSLSCLIVSTPLPPPPPSPWLGSTDQQPSSSPSPPPPPPPPPPPSPPPPYPPSSLPASSPPRPSPLPASPPPPPSPPLPLPTPPPPYRPRRMMSSLCDSTALHPTSIRPCECAIGSNRCFAQTTKCRLRFIKTSFRGWASHGPLCLQLQTMLSRNKRRSGPIFFGSPLKLSANRNSPAMR